MTEEKGPADPGLELGRQPHLEPHLDNSGKPAPGAGRDLRRVRTAIVGGGPAGLSAALVLARAGRRVTVVDAGDGRNAAAQRAHNMFTRDGTPPEELRAIGRRQAEAYGAEFMNASVVRAEGEAGAFVLTLEDGGRIDAGRILLASGVHDMLPDLPGFRDAWGHTVVHCPYCHGHELRDRPTGVLGGDERAQEMCLLLTGWTADVTLLADGVAPPGGRMAEELAGRGVSIRTDPVAALEVEGRELRAVRFADGSRLPLGALYHGPPQRLRGVIATDLGLSLTDGGLVAADPFGRTSVRGVVAAGDAVTLMQQIVNAAASGATTAALLNHELVVGRYPPLPGTPD